MFLTLVSRLKIRTDDYVTGFYQKFSQNEPCIGLYYFPRFDVSQLILDERFPFSITSWLEQNPNLRDTPSFYEGGQRNRNRNKQQSLAGRFYTTFSGT
jgi:hypothetical protein